MTRDEIIRMAREAGFDWEQQDEELFLTYAVPFAALVAAAEREACAKVCEEWLHGEWHNQGVVAACMIRAMGQ